MLDLLKKCFPRPLKRGVKQSLKNIRESFLYAMSRQRPDLRGAKRIVFVCKGNICRSAFAEKYMSGKMGQGWVDFFSCGLDVDQGGYSPDEAVRVAHEFGVDLSSHHAKGFSSCNLPQADLIVAMEYGQYQRLKQLLPEKVFCINLLRDFAPWPYTIFCNINDPYGLGDKVFRRCFRLMVKSLEGLRLILLERTV